jgi:hypothetical protein
MDRNNLERMEINILLQNLGDKLLYVSCKDNRT